MKFRVIGAGLAGVEAAWQIANKGYKVSLYEMKPIKKSEAHKSDFFCELVCSNSLKASRIESAAGLLKEEMARLGSLTVPVARQSSVPAGGALAVDRDIFSSRVTEKIKSHPNIEVINEVVENLELDGDTVTVVATGPLTDGKLAESISEITGEYLSFYDAAAVAAMLSGCVSEGETAVELRGGRLFVTWDRTKNKVLLTGPAETVFEGTLAERI